MPLTYRERPASGPGEGLLVLHHGRGADEHDLLSLADVLDPEQRLHVVTPRGPLQLPGWPGYHWYVVPRVGYPDPDTFQDAYRRLAEVHDDLWGRAGIAPHRPLLGRLSMGSGLSYPLGHGPPPAPPPPPPPPRRHLGFPRLPPGGRGRAAPARRPTGDAVLHPPRPKRPSDAVRLPPPGEAPPRSRRPPGRFPRVGHEPQH